MQADLHQGLFAIQFLFQATQRFIDGLAFFEMHFRHIILWLNLNSAERGESDRAPSERVKVTRSLSETAGNHNTEVFDRFEEG